MKLPLSHNHLWLSVDDRAFLGFSSPTLHLAKKNSSVLLPLYFKSFCQSFPLGIGSDPVTQLILHLVVVTNIPQTINSGTLPCFLMLQVRQEMHWGVFSEMVSSFERYHVNDSWHVKHKCRVIISSFVFAWLGHSAKSF